MSGKAGEPIVGRVLVGRYQILRMIAKGGMATVYEAKDLTLGRSVAVKVMHDGLCTDPAYVTRFKREAISAAGLQHPGIVSIFDQGVDEGRPFIVMEYVPGGTLRHLITNTAPIGPKRAVELMLPIVDAVAYAHESGILHRDLKPENVLIAQGRNQIKVADFGLAKPVASQMNSNPGTLMGTVSYVSPEIVTNSPYDARADVYALGIILFEMLTGVKPHTGDSPVAVAYSHVNTDTPAPSTMLPAADTAIPDYLDALVLAATARQPEKRPANGSVLLEMMRKVYTELQAGVRSNPALAAELLNYHYDPATLNTTSLPDLSESEPSLQERTPVMADQIPVLNQAVADPGVSNPPIPNPVVPAPAGVYAPSPVAPPYNAAQGPSPRAVKLKNQQSRRKWRGLVLVLVVFLIAGLGGFGAWYYLQGRFVPGGTPDFGGMDEKAAAALATQHGIKIRWPSEDDSEHHVYSEDIPADHIVSTDPASGMPLEIGGTVSAFVSKGQERYAVPKLTGKTESAAADALAKTNLKLGNVTHDYSDDVEAGKIISQSIAKGESVKRDTVVDVVVSDGPAPVAITSYVGKAYSEAKAYYKEAGLKVKKTEAYSEELEAGLVISQDPAEGTEAHRGDTITFTVSKGSEYVTVPEVVMMGTSAAKEKLENLGLVVEVVYDSPFKLNIATYTEPGAGNKVKIGSTITLHSN
ncbi:MAG: Stk1 family PASTA domain-containing Ser/Thr kinase [Propionibacteriaceae bacterium]|jgi:serine/threonine-protein kinase|nr:Stk1 family PASTA domain-containing Ser/Thr kinase [Propionibacteriaceae bacterium]